MVFYTSIVKTIPVQTHIQYLSRVLTPFYFFLYFILFTILFYCPDTIMYFITHRLAAALAAALFSTYDTM
jgi:hypothetical protein